MSTTGGFALTIDPRFLPTVEVSLDNSALDAVAEQLGGSVWDWMKRSDFGTEALVMAEVGDAVALPNLPAHFRLRVTVKKIIVPRSGDPYIRVELARIE